jgi:hypothetical protein
MNINQIREYAYEEFESGDNAATAAKLNEATIPVSDDALYTWAGIALVAGPQAAEMLRVALEQNNMAWAVHQFGGSGLQLTNPLVRGAMEQFILAGVPLQPLLDATIYNISPAQKLMGRDITEEEIFQVRLENLKINLTAQSRDFFENKRRAYAQLLYDWDGLTPQPEFEDV